MARKRKAAGRPFSQNNSAGSKADDEAKLRINTYEDVANSEDEFHIGRDKILLDEQPASKRLRLAEGEDAFLEPSDEEVLSVDGDDGDTDDADLEEDGSGEELDQPKSKSKPKRQQLGKPLQESDSEAAPDGAQEEDEGNWGTLRTDYYSTNVNETQEDALAQEAEARRLQQKQLHGMTEADFGLDEVDWLDAHRDVDGAAGTRGKVVTEKLPKLAITDAMSSAEKVDILRARYPEFVPLAIEFAELQVLHRELMEKSRLLDNSRRDDYSIVHTPMPIVLMKYRSLAAYLSALAMYFALFTSSTRKRDGSDTPMPPEQLQEHGIMRTLAECRNIWSRVRDIPEPETSTKPAAGGHTSGDLAHAHVKGSHGVDEIFDGPVEVIKKRKSKQSKAQKAFEAQQAEAEARRLARLQETEASLADLSMLSAPSKPRPGTKPHRTTKQTHNSDSDIGDPTTLTSAELADKARRKKTLRFYTSLIAQKSNKRSAAGRDTGGDDDLPYRERWKDKERRLLKAAADKRRSTEALSGAALDDGSEGDGDVANIHRAPTIPAANGDEDYYDLIASRSRAKKLDKENTRAALLGADIQRITDSDGPGGDGKRAISYAIEKNKGLMNHRKKLVRNPRVKKRNKYEDKKKKLGSMKPVWKGGEGRGGYGGELTGIKRGLVRGTKL